MDEVYVIEL